MDFRIPLDALRGLIATLRLRVPTGEVYAEPVPGNTQEFIFRGLQGVPEQAGQDSTARLVYWVQDDQVFLAWAINLEVWLDGNWMDSFGAYVDAKVPSRVIAAWSNQYNSSAADGFGCPEAKPATLALGFNRPDQARIA